MQRMEIKHKGFSLILDATDLSADERNEFDYIDWDGIDAGTASASFFRCDGAVYDLEEFIVTGAPEGWDAARGDSFFSAIVIRSVDHDDDHLEVGLMLV